MKILFRSIIAIAILVLIIGLYFAKSSATNFSDEHVFVYVNEGKDARTEVLGQIENKNLIKNQSLFTLLADKSNAWKRVSNGRFEIKKGSSLLDIVRLFRNNKQEPVKLVINKLRTRANLAGLLGKKFRQDSLQDLQFLNSNDSLKKLDADTNTIMAFVIPDTYLLNWNLSIDKILDRLKDYSTDFWAKDNRKEKAAKLGLTTLQVYILASIVEEETNTQAEKGNVASVYYNRYKANMPLGADPTIRFALNDFTIKRILSGHLQVPSPYNTYRNKGLPPGPICTPSQKTIDAVLDEPTTKYMYFVANSDFSGTHHFSETYQEHLEYAKKYQTALDAEMAKKANSTK